MNSETLFALFLGHCIGDYLLQNAWMAFNKKLPGIKGEFSCTVHCVIYTLSVMALLIFSGTVGFIYNTMLIFLLIFLSHYIIDRSNFVEFWLRFLRARSWNTHVDLEKEVLSTKESMFISFGAIVYVVADNTMHLFLMYIILKFCL